MATSTLTAYNAIDAARDELLDAIALLRAARPSLTDDSVRLINMALEVLATVQDRLAPL